MARRSPSLLTLLLVIFAAAGAYWKWRPAAEAAPIPPPFRSVPAGQVLSENHFSPAENLEQLDSATLAGAKRSVDIAMYAFTDQFLADRLRDLARAGVRVRLYRDRSQYEEEQRHAAEHNTVCPTDALRAERNVEVRIKADRGRNIMHLKAYLVDGALLRDGSANWSPSGLKSQDNNAHLTNDPAQVRAFQQDFEAMWQRDDNLTPR
jgi:phosphatidylserine/phosphatidylglycerophosphate/cardiolipin synthase-like enzyme